MSMRIVITPGFAALRIKVNPDHEAIHGISGSFEPGLCAPWPDAREKGVIELEIEGETLRELLAIISERYSQVNIDFQPLCPITNDVGFDYDIFVNGKNYITLPQGLNTKLKDGDDVRVKSDEMGHC
jgi:molybdopterin converting factor small subunit